jgi:hypothetical protein
MKKSLILVLAGITALSACSDRRDIPATDNSAQQPDLTLADTASLADTTFAMSSPSGQPVSPVEQAPAAPPRRARRTPPAKAATQPAKAATPPADTSIQAYAPAGPRDTAPARDSVAADSATARTSDATPAPKPDTVAAPAGDTVTARKPDTTTTVRADTTSAADTVVTAAKPSAAPAPSPTPATTGLAARTLAVGTEIHAALDDSITSRRDSVGKTVSAHVMENVTGPDGRTLIPAGTPVRFTVTRLRAARSKESQGRLALRADGIALNGQLRPVKAEVRPVPRELRGRGVTGKEAAKVGAGAVGGAVLGRVVGGNTRGAVIGGVAGAAAGAVVANQTATRDVVVKAKTPVVIVLTAPLTAP